MLYAFSDTTGAVEITELTIPNTSHTNQSGELQSIIFAVTVSYSYDSNKGLDRVSVRLEAEHENEWASIASRETTTNIPQSASKQISLDGDLFDSAWTASDFSVPNEGERGQQSVPIRVIMQATKNGNIVEEQVAETSVTLVLIHEEELTISGEIGGSGEAHFTDAA